MPVPVVRPSGSTLRRPIGVALGALLLLTSGACSRSTTSAADSAESRDGVPSSPGTTFPSPSSDGTAPPGDAVTSPSSGPPEPGSPQVGGHAIVPARHDLQAAVSQPVEDPYYPETSHPEVDALHYFLDLDWDGSVLTADATVTLRAAADTRTLGLGLSDALTVDQVLLDGASVPFSQADDTLEIQTGPLAQDSQHTLDMHYAGAPQSTPAPSLRGDMTEGLGWNTEPGGDVYTFQEPYGAFTWYPANDHPSDEALYDARITTYDGDLAVFNGTHDAVQHDGGATISSWHVDEPMASYLSTLAIGHYTEHVRSSPDGMDISYWLLPQDEPSLASLATEAGKAFDWLEGHAGPYPFSSLGLVVVGGTSAMETQTMITVSRSAADRPDAVLEHELAHQWFGDSVGPRDWQAVWLNEGFAMYYQQWYETDTGRPPFAGGIRHWRPYDLGSRRVSGPPGDWKPSTFGDVNIYLGPALMLDRIRQRLGDAAFEQVLKDWAAEHANQEVDRALFTSWLADTTGQDFGPLIATWLDSPRTPR